jgi:hypothetical protein
MKSNQTASPGLSREAPDRIRRTSNRKPRPLIPPVKHELFKHEDTLVVELNSTYQEHGHRGMWSISIAYVERSRDIHVPDTVDEDLDPRDSEGASFTEGTFEHERRAPH